MELTYGKTFKEFRSLYPITFIIISVNSLLFIATLATNLKYGDAFVQSIFGITNEKFEPWRFVTYAFIHNDVQHFLGNNLFFYLMAPPIEIILGRKMFMIFMMITILITPIGDFLFFLTENLVGSSGIVFGIMAIYYCLFVIRRDLFSKQTIIIIAIWSLMGWGNTFFMKHVSVSGHVTGFIFGLLFSVLVLNKHEINEKMGRAL